MKRVWIAQCLCPARHGIMANAGEASSQDEAVVKVTAPLLGILESLIATGVLKAHCGLCGATRETWAFETGRTRFVTMADAEPILRQVEAEQRAVSVVFGDLPRSD